MERALLPIICGIQKQEFQLDYFTEGSVPAVYISPGDNSITPTQIAELQSALNAIAGDPAITEGSCPPPAYKVEPQRLWTCLTVSIFLSRRKSAWLLISSR